MADYDIFSIGELSLESGRVLPEAKVVYTTYGTLNATKTNAVVLCSYFIKSDSVHLGALCGDWDQSC
jgi:homoserine O-acetyltransferase